MEMSKPKVPKFKIKHEHQVQVESTWRASSEMIDFSNEFRELAEDMMSSITQCRKSTIVVRKE